MTLDSFIQYEAFRQSRQVNRRTVEPSGALDAAAVRFLKQLRRGGLGRTHWRRLTHRVGALEDHYSQLNDQQLDESVRQLREAMARRRGEENLVQSLAALRELAWRQVRQKPYSNQLMAAVAMVHGQVVVMPPGSGKTLAAALAATVLAWSMPSVHVVTANDYLARRDNDLMGRIYRRAGVSHGCVLPLHSPQRRQDLYRCSVVYTTQKELVGDWLRDQVRLGSLRDAVTERLAPADGATVLDRVLLPGLHAVVVDDADSVLIDQATGPLIILSVRSVNPQPQFYQRARMLAKCLDNPRDYGVDQWNRRVRLTEPGQQTLGRLIRPEDAGQWRSTHARRVWVEQALAAEHCFHRRRDYEVAEDRVVSVDDSAGRGRSETWARGMHQAIEAKEGLEITGDRRSLASISFQRFFRMYRLLAGVVAVGSGGLGREIARDYGAIVRRLPTHLVNSRKACAVHVFAKSTDRWAAVVETAQKLRGEGGAVLLGTQSTQSSQQLSESLGARSLAHEILDGVHHDRDAQVMARAGRSGAVTVLTRTAGQGEPIELAPGVGERGGLHVILCEHHPAVRLDLRFLARVSRGAKPGSSQIYVSLEDPLLAKHMPFVVKWAQRLYSHGNGGTSYRLARLMVRWAQWRARCSASNARMAVLRRDDWLDQVMPMS